MTSRTVVKATCPDCGDIKTTIENITLRVLEGKESEDGQYRFLCPSCNTLVLKPATANTISILSGAGAKTEVYQLPLEIMERPKDDVPPITLDDMIDLHEWLESLDGGNNDV